MLVTPIVTACAGVIPGRWLMINKKGRFIPDFITSLPENFTFQFDVICNEKFSFYSNPLHVLFLTGNNDKKAFEYSFIPWEKRSAVKIGVHPAHHNFPVLGPQPHVQITIWLKGVPGSGINIRIPIPIE